MPRVRPLIRPLVCVCSAASLGVAGGCAPVRVSNFRVIDHAIFVHPDGAVRESLEPAEIGRRGALVGARLTDSLAATQLSRLMDSVRTSPHDTILLYVHGGRLTYAKGYGRCRTGHRRRGASRPDAGLGAPWTRRAPTRDGPHRARRSAPPVRAGG